jgi:flagellar protein FliO/FliZ
MEILTLTDLLKFISALLFVLSLMVGLAYIVKRMELKGSNVTKLGRKRVKVLESTNIDARRRLVLIQRDNKQHLVILSPNSETVVESWEESEIETTNLKDIKTDILKDEAGKAA